MPVALCMYGTHHSRRGSHGGVSYTGSRLPTLVSQSCRSGASSFCSAIGGMKLFDGNTMSQPEFPLHTLASISSVLSYVEYRTRTPNSLSKLETVSGAKIARASCRDGETDAA